ncbi:hypothetical protein D3C84_978670 [compost metagenome]
MEPKRADPTPCRIPALSPNRLGEDSLSTKFCANGMTAPSENPMMNRAKNSPAKERAIPEPKEHSEKVITAARKTNFFRFLTSAHATVK